jgi:predicted O-methyltransferase YrrM
MSEDRWSAVDAFIGAALIGEAEAQAETLAANAAAGLPAIDVSPPQGKFLHLLAKTIGATRILEVGTLGGYSTIWLARALPDSGEVISLEYDPKHAEVARANIAREGFGARVDVKVGKALDLLPTLDGPFDLAFLDADKANNPNYFEHALRLVRKGGLIVVDNVVRDGRVLDASGADADIAGIRVLFEKAGADKRITVTAVQTVGAKGWDGFLIALVEG